VVLYLHSSNMSPWRDAQLKHRDNFTFTFNLSSSPENGEKWVGSKNGTESNYIIIQRRICNLYYNTAVLNTRTPKAILPGVGPSAFLDAVVKRKIPSPPPSLRESNRRSSIVQLVA
jgi:hypothetical protein